MIQHIAFILGREWKLSLAELVARYGSHCLIDWSESVALFQIDGFLKHDFLHIGGSIRAIQVIEEINRGAFRGRVYDLLREKASSASDGKRLSFALGAYGVKFESFECGMQIKKMLDRDEIASRFVNRCDENIVSAVFKEEKLGKSETEYNLITVHDRTYLGVTLACQDIDSYARRDLGKSRDMHVGMIPPKLAQIMIHLAHGDAPESTKRGIYDPFVGLGTIPIEAINMGYENILGSDLDPNLIARARESGEAFIRSEKGWIEKVTARGGIPMKDMDRLSFHLFSLDARNIGTAFPRDLDIDTYDIVTEGYLGEIMSKESITFGRIAQEEKKLSLLYRDFFTGLANLSYSGNIVITFPFWSIHGSSHFFGELDALLEGTGFETIPLLPPAWGDLLTPRGTLLYRRPGQQVGREVWRGRLRKVNDK